MPRAAAVDIGTNTVLVTVAEADGGPLRPLIECAQITRLGEGVDGARELSPQAIDRTIACLEDFARLIAVQGVDFVDVVGTSALRDVRSAESFLERAERALGVRPRIVSGEEEAELTFLGSVSGLDVRGNVLVFDVGGGSTELVQGAVNGRSCVTAARSIDIGSVRLFERYADGDPPSARALATARQSLRAALSNVVPPAADVTVVGVAGTVTTLAALQLGLDHQTPGSTHGRTLTRTAIDALAERLACMPLSRRIRDAHIEAGRADVIPFGAVIVSELCRWSDAAELTVSDRGVRWGLLQRRLGP